MGLFVVFLSLSKENKLYTDGVHSFYKHKSEFEPLYFSLISIYVYYCQNTCELIVRPRLSDSGREGVL